MFRGIIVRLLSKLSFRYKLFKYSLVYKRHALLCKILELRHPDYQKKIEKADIEPVFIVGAGRSGNTLLARLLHETGGVHFGPENYTLHVTYLRYLQCIDLPWQERVDCILNILSSQEDAWRWDKVDIDAVRGYLLASDEHTLGNIIHAWYLYYGRSIAYPSERWGCKTPNLTPYIKNFLRVFPAAKVIHIARNPEDTIISFSRTEIEPYNRSPIQAELHWFFSNRLLSHCNTCLTLTYEELSKFPSKVIDKWCYLLGIGVRRHVVFEQADLNYNHLCQVKDKIKFRSYTDDIPINSMTRRLYYELCNKSVYSTHDQH